MISLALKDIDMDYTDATVATFAAHPDADAAIKKLTAANFDIRKLSVVGKGYHTEENAVGFYNTGDRVKFWGSRGAFWGGLWALFFGGLFITTPVIGPVIALGYLAATAIAAIEGAIVVGGLSALGAALYSIGIPKDSVVRYEAAIKADGFIVMVHGSSEEAARAKAILATANATSVESHSAINAKPKASAA
ncbi:hypothetical protein ABIB57_004895 [Devosia sp. UYZn731]|uniref:hypothetical protein n=1 Tax=Devosia sp. UYZn731 TaxID=3156345 RepID=UPI00339A1056